MKIDINKKPNNKIEIGIKIPAEQMDSYFESVARELSKDMNVKGFRPGKVPAEIVEKQLGSEKLYNTAANLAVSRTLSKAVLDNNLEVIGRPNISITKIARGNPMEYKAVFTTVPEIKLGKYKGIKAKKKDVKVADEEVERALKQLQNSKAKFKTVTRPSKKGDKVEVSFVTRSEGAKIEGGESKKHPITLGQGKFIPGFEEKIEGLKSGEEKKFSLVTPKNWPQKQLAGKALDFEVKIDSVQEKEIPELSDEFAKSLGKFSSIKDVKDNIREGLKKEKEEKEKQRIRMEIVDKIVKNSEMEVPQELIDVELDKMVNELKANVGNMGLDFNQYLKQVNKSIEDLKKQWQDQAKKRVKIGLALKKIAEKENIEISDKEVEERINKEFQHYPNPEEVKKQVDLNALKDYTKGVIRNQKVFQLLEREAKII